LLLPLDISGRFFDKTWCDTAPCTDLFRYNKDSKAEVKIEQDKIKT